jgi:hypothetical protein
LVARRSINLNEQVLRALMRMMNGARRNHIA